MKCNLNLILYQMTISVPIKVSIVLLIVCMLLHLSTRDTIIIVGTHYIAHQLV